MTSKKYAVNDPEFRNSLNEILKLQVLYWTNRCSGKMLQKALDDFSSLSMVPEDKGLRDELVKGIVATVDNIREYWYIQDGLSKLEKEKKYSENWIKIHIDLSFRIQFLIERQVMLPEIRDELIAERACFAAERAHFTA